jgi:hypothetical protein
MDDDSYDGEDESNSDEGNLFKETDYFFNKLKMNSTNRNSESNINQS